MNTKKLAYKLFYRNFKPKYSGEDMETMETLLLTLLGLQTVMGMG